MIWLLGQSIINGLLTGGIYVIVAVGITIIFGVMKMINFAAGEFVSIGMYLTWVFYSLLGWDSYALAPFVIIGVALVAFVVFKVCIQPLLERDRIVLLLVTVGLSYFLQNFLQVIFGAMPLSVSSELKSASFHMGGFSINVVRFIACFVALVLVLILSQVINRSNFGRSLRATAENAEVAEMLGIRSIRSFALAFVIGITLSGIAGLLLTPIYFVSPSAGALFSTTPLMIVVLGGLGDIKGAMIAGLIVGIAESFVATLISPELGPLGIFIAYLLVVYFKPQGLFGKGERVG